MAEHANDDHHVALSYAEAYNGNEPRPGDRVSDAVWLQLLLDPFSWERREVFRNHEPGALL